MHCGTFDSAIGRLTRFSFRHPVRTTTSMLKRLSHVRRFQKATLIGPRSLPSRQPHLDWAAKEEPLEKYAIGGYHPVKIGAVLNSRYRTVRKLGWSNYGTAWLAQQQTGNGSQIFRVVKVLTGLTTDVAMIAGDPVLSDLEEPLLQSGHPHILQVLDYFYLQNPQGKHLCYITDPLTEDMRSFSERWKYHRIPTTFLKQVTRQVLLGLEYLHDECDLVHTDIKPENIRLEAPDNRSLSFGEGNGNGDNFVETSTGKNSEGQLISRYRSHPIYYPIPDGDLNSPDTWSQTRVRLGEGSSSCNRPGPWTSMIQSPPFRAPEVCMGAGWGKPADIWSLGCTVYELAMGRPFFNRDIHDESVPFLHVITFGDYPAEMIARAKFRDDFLNKDGSLRISLPGRAPSLKNIIDMHGAPPNADKFVDFLERMLVLDPSKRACCDDLLMHEWLAL
ncbi:hypothetical protein M413DRAFT_32180 [Hebeloma cylindrosporum]|uniref:non-specific serine/threonine protein kinase n=1 Tax=Hebeloma cylindrosporum TaxID=76867 RepID=A0A0C3BUR3_HEBCY|nr:hypothetical protein M413DRAFT_32180 [Hebeloma cylindrosporum h7]